MVFKSQDGRRVIDRDGHDVPPNVASPDSIPDKLPRAEAYRDALDKEHGLERRRDELHHYQQKLDDARDTINKGDVSKKDLDAMDADLQASMPDAVKQKLAHPGQSREAVAPTLDATTQPSAAPWGAEARKPGSLSPGPR